MQEPRDINLGIMLSSMIGFLALSIVLGIVAILLAFILAPITIGSTDIQLDTAIRLCFALGVAEELLGLAIGCFLLERSTSIGLGLIAGCFVGLSVCGLSFWLAQYAIESLRYA